jgi:diguanylate cyclase (GGDEF)-like protein
MTTEWSRLRQRLWSRVPDSVRDDMALLQFAGLQRQIPLLYATVIIVLLITMTMTPANAGFFIRFGLPGTIILTCFIRFVWWLRHSPRIMGADAARHWIRVQSHIACVIAAASSIWTSFSWTASVPAERTYYPMFMAIGLFSATFCMSSIRKSAILLLLSGLTPILLTLALNGQTFDQTAVVLVALAAIFLGRMVMERHQQLVTLLMLQQQMGELAATDALTGLANRRRLFDRLQGALDQGNCPALLLLDLDGFKPINDEHGHAIGDQMLCAIATRLRDSVGHGGLVCRMGGDEFAVVIDAADANAARAVADRLLASLIEPFPIGQLRLRIGASLGLVVAANGESDPHALIAAADTRLYAAKAQGRGNIAGPPAVSRSGTRG